MLIIQPAVQELKNEYHSKIRSFSDNDPSEAVSSSFGGLPVPRNTQQPPNWIVKLRRDVCEYKEDVSTCTVMSSLYTDVERLLTNLILLTM